jgi:hypothetical protein
VPDEIDSAPQDTAEPSGHIDVPPTHEPQFCVEVQNLLMASRKVQTLTATSFKQLPYSVDTRRAARVMPATFEDQIRNEGENLAMASRTRKRSKSRASSGNGSKSPATWERLMIDTLFSFVELSTAYLFWANIFNGIDHFLKARNYCWAENLGKFTRQHSSFTKTNIKLVSNAHFDVRKRLPTAQ